MDIRQLRYFLAIAEEGQITGAANRLHMAQPPLSKQLKQLEQELGVCLMERKGRRMELTEAGKLLYKKASKILHQLDETVTEVKETSKGLRGVLSIGTSISCLSYLPERIKRFREIYPLVNFRIIEGDSFELGDLLKKWDIECAVIRLPFEFNMNEFCLTSVEVSPFIFILPKGWVNPDQTHIDIETIAGIPLVLLHRIKEKRGIHEEIIDEIRRFGFEPQVVCECGITDMLLNLVAAGVGATILPKTAVSSLTLSNFHVMEIKGTSFQSEIAVVWLKDRHLSKTAQQFIESF